MADDGFKVCPFCTEKIRKEAVKCRFCGEWLQEPYRPESGLHQERENAPHPVLPDSNPETAIQPGSLATTTSTGEAVTSIETPETQVQTPNGAGSTSRIRDNTSIPLLLMFFWMFGYAFPRAIMNRTWGAVEIIWGTLIYGCMTPLSIVVIFVLGTWYFRARQRKDSSTSTDEKLKSTIIREQLQAPLASRLRRLGAPLLDGLVVLAIMLPGAFTAWTHQGDPNVPIWEKVTSILYTPLWPNSETLTTYPVYKAVISAISTVGILSFVIFQFYLLSTKGQTVGKWVMKIRIARYADGTNPGFVRAVLLRYILPVIFGFVPIVGVFFVLADYLFIFGKKRRCIHDYLAGTKVVTTEKFPNMEESAISTVPPLLSITHV